MSKREKTKVIEDIEFDSEEFAKSVLTEAQDKTEKCKKAMMIGAVSTVCSFIGLCTVGSHDNIGMGFFVAAVIIAIVSYVIGGGVGTAVKSAFKVAKWGWYVIPSFPADVFIFVCVLYIAFFAFFFVPILFNFINYRQFKKNLEDAKLYLAR